MTAGEIRVDTTIVTKSNVSPCILKSLGVDEVIGKFLEEDDYYSMTDET